MDVYNFLEERQMICNRFYNSEGCDKCPLPKVSCGGPNIDSSVVELVDKYIKNNGKLTNLEKFKQVFPDVPVSLDRQNNLIIDIGALPYSYWTKSYCKKENRSGSFTE